MDRWSWHVQGGFQIDKLTYESWWCRWLGKQRGCGPYLAIPRPCRPAFPVFRTWIEVKFPGRHNASRKWCTRWSMPREHHQHSCSWPSTPHWIPAAFCLFHPFSSSQKSFQVGVTLEQARSKITIISYNSRSASSIFSGIRTFHDFPCHEDTNWFRCHATCHPCWGCNWPRQILTLSPRRCSRRWRIRMPQTNRSFLPENHTMQ